MVITFLKDHMMEVGVALYLKDHMSGCPLNGADLSHHRHMHTGGTMEGDTSMRDILLRPLEEGGCPTSHQTGNQDHLKEHHALVKIILHHLDHHHMNTVIQ